eukprot:scaffold575764_cov23-Prasinocladus_malaysianus.AAC.1
MILVPGVDGTLPFYGSIDIGAFERYDVFSTSTVRLCSQTGARVVTQYEYEYQQQPHWYVLVRVITKRGWSHPDVPARSYCTVPLVVRVLVLVSE